MQNIDRRFDAVVIGSGAAGSMAVKELTERGLDVLLLEAGRDLTDADFEPLPPKPPRPFGLDVRPRLAAMVAGQHRQAMRSIFSESSNRFLVNDRENPYTTPADAPYIWIRGRILGGRLNTYGRVLQRMSDVDFHAASRDGYGEDWPFSYADLEPWYDRVEAFLGVYGNRDGVAHPPDGRYVGAAGLSAVERAFKHKIESRWPDRKVVAWRYAAPNLERVPRGIVAARRTGRLTTRTDAVVSKVTIDERTGLADGAVFIDRHTRREHRVSGDVVVLCASTIETVRLMLNSACSRHPDGLGNSNGLLGRYFMDQTMSLAFCQVPDVLGWQPVDDSVEPDPFYAPTGGILIPRYQNVGPHRDPHFLRGWSYQGVGGRFPVPADYPTSFGLGGAGEMLPSYDNYISIHRKRTDAWGVPIPHIRCVLGENDRILVERQMADLREMISVAGYRINFIGSVTGLDSRQVWPDANPLQRYLFRIGAGRSFRMGAAIHECGGARMGKDPATSVVNGRNQTWDVPNLFVTDGAAFTSSSTVGPALTIMALSARASAFIAEAHATGELRKPTEAVR